MRTRLILLLGFAVSVFAMVHFGQMMADRAAREQAAPTDSEPSVNVLPEERGETPVREARMADRGEVEPEARIVGESIPKESGAVTEIVEASPETAPEPQVITPGATAIEGYVFAEGAVVAGAKVAWRPSRDAQYVPPSWTAPPLDEGTVQHGAHADLTTENPLNPRDSNPIRLGGGFTRYDSAIARTFSTVPGTEYELSLDSRYTHSWDIRDAYGEGRALEKQIGEYGIDPTGQTTDHESPTIQYSSVTDGPNDCWRRFRTRFTAERNITSVWLHAKQLDSHVGLVWFDRLVVRPVGSEEETALLQMPSGEEEGIGDYFGYAVTGPNGYYRIEGISAGDYDLCAAGAGKGSARKERIRVRTAKTATANFNLLGGGVIRGKVLENLSGDPIEGAIVTAKLSAKDRERILAQEVTQTRAARTGPSGEFYLAGLLPGIGYHLTVEAAGYVSPEVRTVVPDGPETMIGLSPAGGVWGVVVLEGTEQPVEGAVVRVLCSELMPIIDSDMDDMSEATLFDWNGERIAATVTDADGRFSIRGLNPGTYSLVAEKDGRRSTQASESAAEITIESKESQALVSLAIPKGSRLRGKVVDIERKTPVAGLDLVLTMESRNPLGALMFRRGEARPVPFDTDAIDDDADGIVESDPVDVTNVGSAEPDSSAPTVDFVPEETLFEPRVWVTTDGEGKFEVDDIGVGRWIVWARGEDHQIVGNQRFTVEGRDITEIELLAQSFETIEGIVLSPERAPVAGASVWPRRFQGEEYGGMTYFEDYGFAHSDAGGRFVIRGTYPDSSYDIVAVTPAGLMATVEGVKSGRENLEIILQPAGSIAGEIRFESGKPLVGVKVSALGGELFQGHWWRDAYTDSEGRFLVHQLVTGCYDLDFGTRWPELHARYGPVRVEMGEKVEGLELVIPGNSRIEGNVRFPDGSAAPGLLVTATKLDNEGDPKRPQHWVRIPPNPPDDDREPELQFDILVHQAYTDDVGDYVIEDLLPGTYHVMPTYPESLAPIRREAEFNVGAETIEVGEQEVKEVDFAMVEPWKASNLGGNPERTWLNVR